MDQEQKPDTMKNRLYSMLIDWGNHFRDVDEHLFNQTMMYLSIADFKDPYIKEAFDELKKDHMLGKFAKKSL